MTLEIERRRVGGVWRTGAVDEADPNGGSQAVKQVVVPISFDDVGLTDGVPVYQPVQFEALLDAWWEAETQFNGTTPKGDLGPAGVGMFANVAAALDMTEGGGLFGNYGYNASGTNPSLVTGAVQSGGIRASAPGRFNGATPDPLLFWVSQDGSNGGDDPGATQGAGNIVLLIAAAP